MNALQKISRFGICCALPLVAMCASAAQEGSQTELSQRSHIVALNQDGLVAGRIVAIDAASKTQSPLSEVNVHFVQNGSIVRSTKTNSDGQFTVDGLVPGAYSFVGSSAKGFLAYGIIVKPFDAVAEQSKFQLVAPAVSPRFVALKEIVDKYLPRKSGVLQQELEIQTSLEIDSEFAQGANLVAIKNGNLVGSVRSIVTGQELAGTRIFLVQNDKVMAESKANEQGSFEINDVEPGVYDFVAVGSAGFAAAGFQAVAQDELAPNTNVAPATQITEVQPVPADGLNTVLTPPTDGVVVADQVESANELGGPVAVGDEFADGSLETCGDEIGCGAAEESCGCGQDSGYCGGGCGGGGGIGGGWGGLASALIAGWVITELADNNNNNNNPNPPTPVSPAN